MIKQWSVSRAALAMVLPAALMFGGCDNSSDGERPLRASNVNVVVPRAESIRDHVDTVGSTMAVQSIDVTSEEDGRISSIEFREGQRVARGDLLVQLDDRQARASLQEAQAEKRNAEARFERARRLRDNNNVSAAEFEELEAALAIAEARVRSAQTRLDHLRIDAPFDGVVGLREVSIGAWLRAGDRITTLDSVDPMELVFSIPERFVGALDSGLTLSARTDAFPGTTFSGEITSMATRVDPVSRSLRLKATLDNSERRLRPGQFMVVSLALRARDALLIPEEAIMTLGDEQFVYLVEEQDGQDRARRSTVSIGTRRPGEVEIIAGVDADSRVVITGHTRLGDGDPVRVLDDDEALIRGGDRYLPDAGN